MHPRHLLILLMFFFRESLIKIVVYRSQKGLKRGFFVNMDSSPEVMTEREIGYE